MSNHFQMALASFVGLLKPEVVVETGLGISTVFILDELERLGSGHLYSIDPFVESVPNLNKGRWTYIKEPSFMALPALYDQTGPWDFFLHDSDHDVENTTFEYELAFHMVKPGGWVSTDDSTWGTPPHRAWQKFLERHNLKDMEVGYARAAQKPLHEPCIVRGMAQTAAAHALEQAHLAAQEYGQPIRYQYG